MPRKARIDAPEALHSISVRGIEGEKTFRDDKDLDNFRNRIGEILVHTGTTCFAWALMPDHAHLLLKTGDTPIAMVMRRLLTGYAVTYNRRHGRHGAVFPNRYRSVLCQENPYLLELVRYIHLNPLRSGIVADLSGLQTYAYAGHGSLAGRRSVPWQDVDSVLSRFGRSQDEARRAYLDYVNQGAGLGRCPDLAGGGLVRSLGGWQRVKQKRRQGGKLKGDERILGDPDFVKRVLETAGEQLHPTEELALDGVNLDHLADRAAKAFGVEPAEMLRPGKYPDIVQARSVFCYWAVRRLGCTATGLANRLRMTQPAVSISVRRGEKIAQEMGLKVGKESS